MDYRPHILLIDSETPSVDALAALLDPYRFRVSVCLSVEDALTVLADQEPEIVIGDAEILYSEGADFPDRAREASPRSRVLFLDWDGDWLLLLEVLERGGHDLLINPCRQEDLNRTVDQILDAAPARWR